MQLDIQHMPILQKRKKFKNTLVLTLDAFGDHLNYTAKLFKILPNGNLKIKNISQGNDFIIGRLYRYVTLIMGLKPNEHEYKVMGLAPYCNKDYSNKILKILRASKLLIIKNLSL